ncbi:hypothetical protein HK101_002093 [Irineochytrium annulatum]|nr:hypothetical protein HK101_002093 [Irineochytrium annulatum]
MTPPRYQPLSVDQSGATYRSNSSSTGMSNSRSSSRSAFYCACIPNFAQDLWGRFSQRLPDRTMVVGYVSGGLFALGWWIFIDGVAFANTRKDPPVEIPIRFDDWLPGILSTLALIIVNLIDKDTLNADDFSYSGSNVACKARACAFIGVTMALGALGGALAILSLKYIMTGQTGDGFYFGIAITAQNVLIFLGNSSTSALAPTGASKKPAAVAVGGGGFLTPQSRRLLASLTGIHLSVFVLAHLSGHIISIVDFKRSNDVLMALRPIYQHPVVEAANLLMVLGHAVAGSDAHSTRWKEEGLKGRKGFWRLMGSGSWAVIAHRVSGTFSSFCLVIHTYATRIFPYIYFPNPSILDLTFITHSLTTGPTAIIFHIYYTLFVTSTLYHTFHGLYVALTHLKTRLAIKSVSVPRISNAGWKIIAGAGFAAGVAIVVGMAGYLQVIDKVKWDLWDAEHDAMVSVGYMIGKISGWLRA